MTRISSAHNEAGRLHRTPPGGFTMAELLVVIAIIGVLIGLLVPAVEPNRADVCLYDVEALAGGEIRFHNLHDRYSPSLVELGSAGVIDTTLATGSKDGFYFTILSATQSTFSVCATPLNARLNSYERCCEDEAGRPHRERIPGARQQSKAIYRGLVGDASMAVSQLLAIDQSNFSQVAPLLASPDTVGSVFALFDANHDGVVTPAEILSFDTSEFSPQPKVILDGLLADVQTTVGFGNGNENVGALPGVPLARIARHDASKQLFSRAGVCRLGREFSTDRGLATQLCRDLKQLAAASRHGDLTLKQAALDAYVDAASTQAGRSLTVDQAATLVTLARTL